MNNFIILRCGSSTMELNVENFFPTTQAKLIKLINIILHSGNEPELYLEQIQDALKERLEWIQKKRSYYCYMDADPIENCEIDRYYVDLQHKAVKKTMDLIVKTQERLAKNYEVISGICEDQK